MNPILIPIIRNLPLPHLLVQNICNVQPMQSNTGNLFKIKRLYVPRIDQEGDLRHSLLDGWQRYYGTEWISTTLWWKLKIKGL